MIQYVLQLNRILDSVVRFGPRVCHQNSTAAPPEPWAACKRKQSWVHQSIVPTRYGEMPSDPVWLGKESQNRTRVLANLPHPIANTPWHSNLCIHWHWKSQVKYLLSLMTKYQKSSRSTFCERNRWTLSWFRESVCTGTPEHLRLTRAYWLCNNSYGNKK